MSDYLTPPAELRDGLPVVERVLLVVAHPDDIDFSSGGTVARFTDAGVHFGYLIATRGDQGGFDDTPRDQIAALREQRAAAAVLGVHDVRFLEERDGHVEITLALRKDISRVIRDVRPQLVITHSPDRNWTAMPANHPDHMAMGEATLRAVYPDARNPFAFPELLADEALEPWTVREVWIAGDEHADHVVDITATLDRKIEALRAHASQTSQVDLDAMLAGWNGAIAREAGLGDGASAEAFRRVLIQM